MSPFSWLLRRRNLAYLLVGAGLLLSAGLVITFFVSDGHKVAVNAVFESAKVERAIGPVDSALLTGSSSKYSGTFGCADFRYLVFGQHGTEIVQVRVESRGAKVNKWKVLELIEGGGGDFNVACWQKD